MSTCCQQLKSKVLSRVGTVDLNQLSMQIHRLEGIHWREMTENDELFSKIPTHLTTPVPRTKNMSVEDWNTLTTQRKEEFTTAANAIFWRRFGCRFELRCSDERIEIDFETPSTMNLKDCRGAKLHDRKRSHTQVASK